MLPFGITLGDPCGIGPEIVLKALYRRPQYIRRCVLFGSRPVLEYYSEQLGFGFGYAFHSLHNLSERRADRINVVEIGGPALEELPIGQVCAAGGESAFRSVEAAIGCTLRGELGSVVTGPLSKEALQLAGHPYTGHTHIFSQYYPGDSCALLLWSEPLKVIHVTAHKPLRQVSECITREWVAQVIRMAHRTLCKAGVSRPCIAVAGLNPHAGESGLFGEEEEREIRPAVMECREEGIAVAGPFAADTAFMRTFQGEFDMVVAMYHDQGHPPFQLLARDKGAIVTVGLEVLRTSVDHGTAFDIAGKLIAQEGSMLTAMELGELL